MPLKRLQQVKCFSARVYLLILHNKYAVAGLMRGASVLGKVETRLIAALRGTQFYVPPRKTTGTTHKPKGFRGKQPVLARKQLFPGEKQ